MIRRVIYMLLLIVAPSTLFAQSASSIYFIDKNPIRHELNPAFATEKGYFSFPFFGSMSFETQTNLGLSSVLYPYEGGLTTFLNSSIPSSTAMDAFDTNNIFNANFKLPLISFGFNKWGGFNTFGSSIKVSSQTVIPYDMISIMKVGMTNPTDNYYDLSSLSFNTTAYGEVYFGHSREILPGLRVGAKVKMLLGVANISAQFENFDVNLSEDLWRISNTGTLTVNGATLEYDEDGLISDIDEFNAGLNGFGLAFDLGATYKVFDELTVAASITDLGYIKWNGEYTSIAQSQAEPFEFTGFENITTGEVEEDDENSLDNQIESLSEDISNLFSFYQEKMGVSTTSNRTAMLRVSGEYAFLDNFVSVGLLSTTSFGSSIWTDLMASVICRPADWFTVAVNGSVSNLGTGCGATVSFNLDRFNLYVGANTMTLKFTPQGVPIGTTSMALNFGVNFMLEK